MAGFEMRGLITLAIAVAIGGCMKSNPLADAIEFGDSGVSGDSADAQSDDGDFETGGSGDGDSGDGDSGDSGDGDSGDGDSGDGDSGDGDSGDSGDSGDGDSGDGDSGDPPEPGDGDGDSSDPPEPAPEPAPDPGDGDGDPGDDEPMPPPDLGDPDPGSCESFQGFETECAECLSDGCCAAAATCSDTPGCECLAACDLGGNSEGFCKSECGVDPDDVPELSGLLTCAANECEFKC